MTKPNPNKPPAEKPNKQLQAALRQRITEQGLLAVVRESKLGHDSIRSYLADLPMRPSTLWGIEHRVAMLTRGAMATNGHAQEAQSANASRR